MCRSSFAFTNNLEMYRLVSPKRFAVQFLYLPSILVLVGRGGLEPPSRKGLAPKASASANFAIYPLKSACGPYFQTLTALAGL
jgi:hypothetical protein